jgi:uracil phosphoribosyltransferase
MKKMATIALFLSVFSLPSFGLDFYSKPQNPCIEYHLYKIRDPQTNRADFREHMSKIGEYLALTIAPSLPSRDKVIETSLGASARQTILDDSIAVVTILRAGLPLFQGFLQAFPNAEGGFLVYQRDHKTLQPVFHASLLPSLEGKSVIIVDPMIATGGSIIAAIKHIMPQNPKSIFVACAIGSIEGLGRIHQAFPEVHLYAAAVDSTLNDKGYIVPGLGDAGDRSFGPKHEEKYTKEISLQSHS